MLFTVLERLVKIFDKTVFYNVVNTREFIWMNDIYSIHNVDDVFGSVDVYMHHYHRCYMNRWCFGVSKNKNKI